MQKGDVVQNGDHIGVVTLIVPGTHHVYVFIDGDPYLNRLTNCKLLAKGDSFENDDEKYNFVKVLKSML